MLINGDCKLLSGHHEKILRRGGNLPEKSLRMSTAEILGKQGSGDVNCHAVKLLELGDACKVLCVFPFDSVYFEDLIGNIHASKCHGMSLYAIGN